MPAYIVSMMSIHDPETYSKYTGLTPAIVRKHGGKFLTRGGDVKNLEGTEYDGRLVLLEFPSRAAIDEWLNDPEYQEAAVFRHASSTMNYLMVQEGSSNTEDPDPKL